MSATFKTTLEREKRVLIGDGHTYDDVCVEVDVEVTYEYSKAQPETWGYDGGTPAEPEQCEILSAVDTETGNELTLSDSEVDHLEQEALDDVRDRYEAAMEAKADARRDDR
jgi:hypothetical protein